MSDVHGAEAPVDLSTIVVRTAGGDGPLTARAAANSLIDQRRKEAAAERTPAPERAAPVEPPESPAQAVDADPDESPAPGETQDAEPADQPLIEPPKSWTKDAKDRWQTLPRDTQEYLAQREQERDRATRTSQNDAAEKLKGLTAKEQAAEQARQTYESALPILLQSLQEVQAGEFHDVNTMADVERLAREDWPRYVQWDASQKKLAAVQQQLQSAQQRQAAEQSAQWREFSAKQDELFTAAAPEFADKEKAAKMESAATDVLADLGFSTDELRQSWDGKLGLSLRDHRVQLLIRDAVLYRQAKSATSKVTAKPLPPVQRPGVAQPRGAAQLANVQGLVKKLENSTGINAARAAAELMRARRAATR